ncbi:hypothetical protein LZZ85_08460 [Terrimonas sp. NA20]|uniref:Gliding motility-associated protein GldM C-terminal domain-containing protein n=1 Tax=Terrimonas ginsenosidimutans TaxID=2908004 RepID=A0ABS9KPQ6_9BACT|nr:GldM family protein [Terrimonas ginsenosidimutans]MCG2614312.1 hypothetical protein [Terrimonas ginsenosidimutans]
MNGILFSISSLFFAVSFSAQPELKNLSLTDPAMDIIYIGVVNDLAVEGVSERQNMEVVVGGKDAEGSNGRYYAMVHTPGTVKVDVYRKVQGDRRLLTSKVFRSVLLSRPKARLMAAADSNLSVGVIIANPQLETFYPGSQFKSDCDISSFMLKITDSNGEELLEQTGGEENRLTEKMITLIRKLKPGDKLFFDEIRVFCRDGRGQKFEPFTVYIK